MKTDLALGRMETGLCFIHAYLTLVIISTEMFFFMHFRTSCDIILISLLLFIYDEAGCVRVSDVKERWSKNVSSKSPYSHLWVNRYVVLQDVTVQELHVLIRDDSWNIFSISDFENVSLSHDSRQDIELQFFYFVFYIISSNDTIERKKRLGEITIIFCSRVSILLDRQNN